ncbi:MAG: DUF87 domain-containing protein, partial [Victivallaceae bacterium]|nr:DUF87 domain-containing protein [Victivallaceae bacterium]
MDNFKKDLSYGMWAFNYLSAMAHSAGMERDKRVLSALKYISLKSRDQQAVKAMLSRTLGLIKKSPGYIASQLNDKPFTPNPAPGIIDGEIKLGSIYDEIRKIRYPFGISRSELMQHMLLSGRAGAGKTTLLIIILINLLRLLIPFWIFDFKRDYRSLLRFSDSVYVFNQKTFKFNPLIPPKGTAAIQWASIFTDIFFQIFYSTSASSAKSIFLGTLKDIYKNNGTPTLMILFQAMCRKLYDDTIPPNSKDSIRTIMLRLEPFIDIFGDSICGQGFDMAELLQKEVVLELDGLTIEYQTFLATLIFHWIFTYRLNLAQRGELMHTMIFDEAKRLFSLN